MQTKAEFLVTLSDELFDCLRGRARELRVPLKYLVASLVCDTVEMAATDLDDRAPQPTYHVA
jgi:hypothetical protein